MNEHSKYSLLTFKQNSGQQKTDWQLTVHTRETCKDRCARGKFGPFAYGFFGGKEKNNPEDSLKTTEVLKLCILSCPSRPRPHDQPDLSQGILHQQLSFFSLLQNISTTKLHLSFAIQACENMLRRCLVIPIKVRLEAQSRENFKESIVEGMDDWVSLISSYVFVTETIKKYRRPVFIFALQNPRHYRTPLKLLIPVQEQGY